MLHELTQISARSGNPVGANRSQALARARIHADEPPELDSFERVLTDGAEAA